MSSNVKSRADQVLVSRGLVSSRAKAQAEIEAGRVFCDGVQIRKSSQAISESAHLEITGTPMPWVSRAGLKLDHGLRHFALELSGRTVLDIGASTGGFTDVALARGAARVIAVDVGHGQLHDKLKKDPRVISLEGVNAKDLTVDHLPHVIDAIVCDVSFISLQKALPAALDLVRPGALLIALIKPQFEVGPAHVGKGGVVRDAQLHSQTCDTIRAWFEGLPDWHVLGVTDSPITGSDGNKEFLIAAQKTERFV